MAFATGRSMAEVAACPYHRTLREFYHLQQHERFTEIRERGRALHAAGLMAVAFHEPKRLGEEHRRFLVDAGLTVPVDTSREQALALIAEVAGIDQRGAWTKESVS